MYEALESADSLLPLMYTLLSSSALLVQFFFALKRTVRWMGCVN